jgi:hypothetical protein
MKRSQLVFLAFAIALIGCSSKSDEYKPSDRRFFDKIFGSDPYAQAFNKMTQEDRVNSEFEPILTVQSTFWNDELQNIYIKEKAYRFRLNEEETATLAQEQLEMTDKHFVFIISMNTRDPRWNHLEKFDGLWRTSLESESSDIKVLANRIDVISRNDEQARYFYKSMTLFNRTYRVYFPREKFNELDKVFLHIAGPRGRVQFKFNIDSQS